MGRGRQKAKNTKVARELKYFSPSTDYNALEAELASKAASEEELYEDKWADLYDESEDSIDKPDPSDDDREVELERD
jgi:hypothetical protein